MPLRTQRRRSAGKVLHNSSVCVTGALFSDGRKLVEDHSTAGINLTPYSGRSVTLDGAADYVASGRTFTSTFQDDFSILLWHRAADGTPSASRGFWGVSEGVVDDGGRLWAYLSTTGYLFVHYMAGTGDTVNAKSGSALFSNGQQGWNSFVCTVGESNNIKIFHNKVDQTLDGTDDGDMTGITMTNYANASESFGIGCRNLSGSPQLYWDGELSFFVILDRIATQAEINQFHDNPTTLLSNMTACYPISEYIASPSADDPAVDVSGNDFHGTLPSGGTISSEHSEIPQMALLDFYKYTHTSDTDIYVPWAALSSAPSGYSLAVSQERQANKDINFNGLGYLAADSFISLVDQDSNGTICVWMYINSSFSTIVYPVAYTDFSTNAQDVLAVAHDHNGIYLLNIDGGSVTINAKLPDVEANKWHFLGLAMSGDSKYLGTTFVLNGLEVTATYATGSTATSSWFTDSYGLIDKATVGAYANNSDYASFNTTGMGLYCYFNRALPVTKMVNVWRQTKRFFSDVSYLGV
jgi:hypothetical protein